MNTKILISALILAASVGGSHSAYAQGQKPPSTTSTWVTGGLGTAGGDWISGSAALGFRYKNVVFSLRNANVLQGGLWFNTDGSEYHDVGLLAGYGWLNRSFMASIGAGIGFVGGGTWTCEEQSWFFCDVSRTQKLHQVPGLALEAQVVGNLGGVIGLGLYAFGNLNQTHSFAGLSLQMYLGDLR